MSDRNCDNHTQLGHEGRISKLEQGQVDLKESVQNLSNTIDRLGESILKIRTWIILFIAVMLVMSPQGEKILNKILTVMTFVGL